MRGAEDILFSFSINDEANSITVQHSSHHVYRDYHCKHCNHCGVRDSWSESRQDDEKDGTNTSLYNEKQTTKITQQQQQQQKIQLRKETRPYAQERKLLIFGIVNFAIQIPGLFIQV